MGKDIKRVVLIQPESEGGNFEYLSSETGTSAAALILVDTDLHQATFGFWADSADQSKNSVAVAFKALQDGRTYTDFWVLTETLLR